VTPLLSTCQKPLLHTPTCSAALLLRRHAQRSPSRPVSAFHSLSIFLLHDAFIIHHSSFNIRSFAAATHTHSSHASARFSTRVHTQINTNAHYVALSHFVKHTYIHTHAHTHAHSHAHTHTHTHTHKHTMLTDRQTY